MILGRAKTTTAFVGAFLLIGCSPREQRVEVRSLGQASHEVVMKIFTPKGFVAFRAEGNWAVLSMQSKLPIAAATFQLPNPADEGTPDSTNLVLMLYDPESADGRAGYAAPVKQYGDAPPRTEVKHGWTIYRQEARQNETLYSVWDARREDVAGVKATVRLAWPHLSANVPDYASRMSKTFDDFLISVRGHVGPYTPLPGEVTRRPQK